MSTLDFHLLTEGKHSSYSKTQTFLLAFKTSNFKKILKFLKLLAFDARKFLPHHGAHFFQTKTKLLSEKKPYKTDA